MKGNRSVSARPARQVTGDAHVLEWLIGAKSNGLESTCSVARSGIVVCTVDADFVAPAERVDAAITGQDLASELIRVNRGNTRPSVAPNAVGVVANG